MQAIFMQARQSAGDGFNAGELHVVSADQTCLQAKPSYILMD
jgi:hypothetical protein